MAILRRARDVDQYPQAQPDGNRGREAENADQDVAARGVKRESRQSVQEVLQNMHVELCAVLEKMVDDVDVACLLKEQNNNNKNYNNNKKNKDMSKLATSASNHLKASR